MYVIYVKHNEDFEPRFSFNPEKALKISREIQKIVGADRKVIIEKIVTKPFLANVVENYYEF